MIVGSALKVDAVVTAPVYRTDGVLLANDKQPVPDRSNHHESIVT